MKLRVFTIIFSIILLAANHSHSKPRISNYDLRFTFDFDKKKLFCDGRLTIKNLKQNDTLSVLLYRLLKVKSVKDKSGRPIPFKQTIASFLDWDELQVNAVEVFMLHANQYPSEEILQIEYEGYLFGYTETGMNYVKDNIDSNFTLLREDCYAYPVHKWGSQTDVTCILQEASAFKSERKLYELYHEISHLWNIAPTDKSPCRLESEGLAVFFQYLMMEKLNGRIGLLDSSAQKIFVRVKNKLNQDSLAAVTPII